MEISTPFGDLVSSCVSRFTMVMEGDARGEAVSLLLTNAAQTLLAGMTHHCRRTGVKMNQPIECVQATASL
jgi:hypothetical protein